MSLQWFCKVSCCLALRCEVILAAVEVQDAVAQAEEVNQLRQVGLSSVDGDARLELVQGGLSTAAPLVDQRLELV